MLSNLCRSHAPRRGLVALAVVILCSGRPSRAEEGLIRLENSSSVVEFERGHGKLTRFYDKRSRTELISEPRLASNFQLLIPLPKLEGNYFRFPRGPLDLFLNRRTGGRA
jgi:hypothetical protein